jgi:type III pantothenate kinase
LRTTSIDGSTRAAKALPSLGEPATVVATGGLAHFVIPLCRHKIHLDDNLLLKGLLFLYRKNS